MTERIASLLQQYPDESFFFAFGAGKGRQFILCWLFQPPELNFTNSPAIDSVYVSYIKIFPLFDHIDKTMKKCSAVNRASWTAKILPAFT